MEIPNLDYSNIKNEPVRTELGIAAQKNHLSEDIILGCGFTKSESSGSRFEFKEHYSICFEGKPLITIADVSDRKQQNSGFTYILTYRGAMRVYGVRYVDELQDLYLTLTGKELEVKL